LQIAVLLRALDLVGMDIDEDVRVIVDLRRYLGWQYIDGNFVAGVPMRLHSMMSPGELSASMRATMKSGRPLANQILASTRAGGPGPMPTSVDESARPRVAFTNMGRSPEIDCLPFDVDLPPVYAGSVPPEGPLGITFLFGESPGLLSLNATFHDNVVDADLIAAALDLAALDPIALLSGSTQTTRP
jgi:hypothetical protein